MGKPPKSELWGVPYYRGKIAGKDVVVAITGIGKTFTGMTTTLVYSAVQASLGAHERHRRANQSGSCARATSSSQPKRMSTTTAASRAPAWSIARFNGPDNGNEVQNAFSPPSCAAERGGQGDVDRTRRRR